MVRSRLLQVLSMLLLALGMISLSACGGGGSVEPQAVLDKADPAMKALTSFHFVYEVKKPDNAEPSAGLEITRITGDITADGNMQAAIDLLQAGLPLQLQFVAVGDTHYIQDPISEKWQSIPATTSPVGELSLSAGTIQILERIEGTKYVGDESVDGTTCHHLSGKVEATDMAAIAGAVSVTGALPCDLWIGTADYLVRKVEVVGATTKNEVAETVRTISLSKFDEDVTIQAPQ